MVIEEFEYLPRLICEADVYFKRFNERVSLIAKPVIITLDLCRCRFPMIDVIGPFLDETMPS